MRRASRIALAGAALLALALPTLAAGQGAAPRLTEVSGASFPDREYLLQLPSEKALTAENVTVTENGGAVLSLAVEPPGTGSGAVLLIDASNSMRGAPIAGAMAAARAFLAERRDDFPVAIVTFGGDESVLVDFTTDEDQLSAAVAQAPPLTEGTVIYDALVRAAGLIKDEGFDRGTVVLLSDGTDFGSSATLQEALAELGEANVRVISVGLRSDQYDPQTLRNIAQQTRGTYAESATPAALEPLFEAIGQRLSNEYVITYRSLLPASREAVVRAQVEGFPAATATYTTPALDLSPRGTFEREWVDDVILSPWLMVFVVVSVLALAAFAVLTVVDVRRRSLKRRMAAYISVPTEEESRARRAEVAALLAERAERRIKTQRWWQAFETDVDLGGFRMSPLAIAGWTIVAGIVASLALAIALQSLWGLLIGLVAPFVTRFLVSRRVTKRREEFAEQLPDNLDVLAGAMRTGHSVMGALAVMVESASEPSQSEFKRVLQDEQLGVPLDDALMVMARRMRSQDAEQVALVMRLQREAGGNTAEVLDRVAETIRGRMELRRLVNVLTAQARISRWILTGLPIFLLVALSITGGDYLDPLTGTSIGRVFLGIGVVMIFIGSMWIKRIATLDV
ncbi:MAG TPA: VWA domain-containing protein [Gaiellaceae bacterium]|nr:VWA domain-containing protein [Gaiellaceae bacterium]